MKKTRQQRGDTHVQTTHVPQAPVVKADAILTIFNLQQIVSYDIRLYYTHGVLLQFQIFGLLVVAVAVAASTAERERVLCCGKIGVASRRHIPPPYSILHEYAVY